MKWQIGDVHHEDRGNPDHGWQPFHLASSDARGNPAHLLLIPHFADAEGRLKMSIHALMVEAPGQRVIVDTFLPTKKDRRIPTWNDRQGRFLEDLAAAGFPRETIDTCFATNPMLKQGHVD